MNLLEIIKATAVGLVTGAVFSIFKLPIPAPPVLSGIMGIVGIFLGYLLVGHFIK